MAPGSTAKLLHVDLTSQTTQIYYEMAGWDAKGRPTAGKLAELGIADVKA
jgi:aldehyde:ferredoxin oxidoreductase